jgi:hypothetical protein
VNVCERPGDTGGRWRIADEGPCVAFKLLKDTTDDLQGRTLREQLSAGMHQVVERITLYPMGWNAKGTKEARFIDVLFRNGAERRIEAGECWSAVGRVCRRPARRYHRLKD